jgi:pyruvate dehydrogenase phosphatase
MKLSRWLKFRLDRPAQTAAASVRSKAATDNLLRANERSIVLSDGAISRIDVSELGANRPVEDFYSASKCISSNAHFLGVFDGHAGAACGRHVSTRLYDYLSAAVLQKHCVLEIANLVDRLQWIFSNADHHLLPDVEDAHEANVKKFHRKFKSCPELGTVRKALQAAFVALDEDLSNGAMPDSNGQVNKMSVNIAASGACALVAHIRNNNLHVTNIGDSEAVLGVNHANGITARLLSRPHTVNNADEINRIRSAHPASESATILRGGRLLGELFPLRAFGDLRYKWPFELQKVVLEPLGVPAPRDLHTPPYLTALPEVLYHRLTPNDKFLVLATDGKIYNL